MRASKKKVSSMMKRRITSPCDHAKGMENEKNTMMREKSCNSQGVNQLGKCKDQIVVRNRW